MGHAHDLFGNEKKKQYNIKLVFTNLQSIVNEIVYAEVFNSARMW